MTEPIQKLILPFQRFLKAEASGGILLLLATACALLWANSQWSDSYQSIWSAQFTVGVGSGALSKPILLWVNDGLMAIFFFVVGLEIKREVLVGELKSPRQALLPIAAALGGMAGPALVYVALNFGKESAQAWGVPMATDIAFAVGILALLGRHVPLGLKIFLTALAIVDDLGAVIVIAIFYTEDWHDHERHPGQQRVLQTQQRRLRPLTRLFQIMHDDLIDFACRQVFLRSLKTIQCRLQNGWELVPRHANRRWNRHRQKHTRDRRMNA